MTDNRFIGRCLSRDDGLPHGPHVVDVAHCDHEVTTFCYGVPEPGGLADQIGRLEVGQRVRVVWEGVVSEPVRGLNADVEREPVMLSTGEGTYLVLRYTGKDPFRGEDDPGAVAGTQNTGVVSVEVLP